MKAGHILGCHQKEERSFSICNYQFPVCARCTGVLLGEWFSLFVIILGLKPSYLLIIPTLTIMGIDWSLQALKILESTNIRRLITGFCGGIGIMNMYVVIIRAIVQFFSV